MRWLALLFVLALGWLAFTLSPLWSLYDLAQAVRARDVPYVERHVDVRALRLSLVRQTTAALRMAIDASPSMEPREQQRLGEAAGGLALALAETLVTPETVIDLLDDGWPQGLDIPRPAREPVSGLGRPRLGELLPYYLALEMRGFRTVVLGVPPEAPRADQTRIRLRLRAWTWRVIDIEVTPALRQRMADRLGKALARMHLGEKARPENAPREMPAPRETPAPP